VPKVIHQQYKKRDHVPTELAAYVRSCKKLNPDYLLVMWTDDDFHFMIDGPYKQYKKM
jgi:mannosyltransferase OCH1-like enzyme